VLSAALRMKEDVWEVSVGCRFLCRMVADFCVLAVLLSQEQVWVLQFAYYFMPQNHFDLSP